MNDIKIPKVFKGEKYIYLLMAYKLAKQNGGNINIGNDNGYIGGQNYYRNFHLFSGPNGETILIEEKNHRSFADLSRAFEITQGDNKRPTIKEYWNEHHENCSKNWVH